MTDPMNERLERLVEFMDTLGPTEEELDAEEEDRRFEAFRDEQREDRS